MVNNGDETKTMDHDTVLFRRQQHIAQRTNE